MRRRRGLEWLNANKDYAGDNCIQWPMNRVQGYGMVWNGKRLVYAHRLMCEMVNGPAPEGHEAAHSCGNGVHGCCNPRHLRWRTRSENEREKIAHGHSGWDGTRARRRHVLTPEQVAAIRASDKTVHELSRQYGVTPSNIRKILKRETWVIDGERDTGVRTRQRNRAMLLRSY